MILLDLNLVDYNKEKRKLLQDFEQPLNEKKHEKENVAIVEFNVEDKKNRYRNV